MAIFLFLVSVTASTLLLLAIAIEEALSATRRLLARWIAARKTVHPGELEHAQGPARSSERPERVVRAQPDPLPSRAKLVNEEDDWDRAA